MEPVEHDDPSGFFSSEAAGRALGRRTFDWQGVQIARGLDNQADPERTLQGAFAPVPSGGAPAPYPVLGIFVHQGAHYTAMIRRGDTVHHVDSRPIESGEGQYVFEVSAALFLEYAQHFQQGRFAPGGRRVGGMFRVFYVGAELLDVQMEE